jgi:succinoglycan biosynthesis transport protein ExoP
MTPENLPPHGGLVTVDHSPISIDATRITSPDSYSPHLTHPNAYLVDYWRTVLKHRWTIAAFTLIVVTLVTVVSFRMRPQYVATSQIAIYREGSESLSLHGEKPDTWEDWDSNIDLDTQVKVLQSDALAMQVVRGLKLDQNRNFIRPSDSDPTDARREAALLKTFHDGLKVTVLPRTRVVQIQFTNPDPKLAAEIVNALGNVYIEQNFKTKFESTMRTSEWLSRQLADLQIRVETSQEKLVRYQKEKGILGLDEKQNIVTSKLDELNRQLTQSQADRIVKEANHRMAEGGNTEYLASTDGNLLEKLRAQKSDLEVQLAQASTQFGPSYPKVLELSNQIKQVERSIANEVDRIRHRARTDYQAALSRERMLQNALEAQKNEANQLNESAIDYNLLKRDVDSNRQLYEGLLQKLKEAGVTAGLRSSNVRVIDTARVPVSPSKPNIPRNIALGFFIGLFGGLMLAFVLETLDNTVTTPEQVETLSGLPCLGIIPAHGLSHSRYPALRLAASNADNTPTALIAHGRPKSDMAESYRSLRTSVLLSGLGTPPKVVLVTSAMPQEGKTTTAINTAIVLAQKGGRVLLIDADMRRPGVAKTMQLTPRGIGLSTVLAGGDKLEDAIVPSTLLPNLWILPAEPLPPHPAELLASERMHDLLTECRNRFDHVLVDAPPVLSVTDPVLLSVQCDAVLLVIRAGKTAKHALRRSRETLARVGARILGVVVNAVDIHATDSYYYYYYGSKQGGKYYETAGTGSSQ